MWVLDFMEQRFHNMSPGDFESVSIKAGDSEMKERLKIEEATGEKKSERRGPWRQAQG